jgi:hypothetical protein
VVGRIGHAASPPGPQGQRIASLERWALHRAVDELLDSAVSLLRQLPQAAPTARDSKPQTEPWIRLSEAAR